MRHNDEHEIASKMVELNSKFQKENFSKNANKDNSPKASDIVNQISNTIKKKEGE